jgi:hypothetical protein
MANSMLADFNDSNHAAIHIVDLEQRLRYALSFPNAEQPIRLLHAELITHKSVDILLREFHLELHE